MPFHHSQVKLGKKEAVYDDRTLRFASYLKAASLPYIPLAYHWGQGVPHWPMYGNDTLGCHDSQTEVLTDRGWKFWTDYNGKELLATVSRNGFLEYQAPTSLIQYDYDGPMFFSDHQSLDFVLTPNHRMLHRPYVIPHASKYVFGTSGYGNWQFLTMDKLSNRVALPAAPLGFIGTELTTLRIGDREWKGDDFLAFLALVISDGYASGSETNKDRIGFCCFNPIRYEMVAEFSQRLGIKEQPGRKGVWNIRNDPALAEWLRTNIYADPSLGSQFKRIPEIVKWLTPIQMRHFLNFFGDKDHQKDSPAFYTSSRYLADDLQEILLRTGVRSRINRREIREPNERSNGQIIKSNFPSFEVHPWNSSHVVMQRLKRSPCYHVDHYKGSVFCAEVPNSTLITRRNDQLLISGNCCTISGAAHHEGVWTFKTTGTERLIPETSIVSAYSTVSGYVPGDPSTDNGANMLTVMKLWKSSGLFGSDKLFAYVSLEPGNNVHVRASTRLFGGVYLGIQLPVTAQTQVKPNGVWSLVPGYLQNRDARPGSWGGHLLPVIGYDTQTVTVITWAMPMTMTYGFLNYYSDEAYAPLSTQWINAQGVDPDHFDLAQLQEDLTLIT